MKKHGFKFLAVFFLALMTIAGVQIYRAYSVPPLPFIGTVPAFTLTSQDHRTITPASFKGSVVIADFIFTSCAGPCPLMSSQFEEFQQTLSGQPNIRLLSFSVDPETDTP